MAKLKRQKRKKSLGLILKQKHEQIIRLLHIKLVMELFRGFKVELDIEEEDKFKEVLREEYKEGYGVEPCQQKDTNGFDWLNLYFLNKKRHKDEGTRVVKATYIIGRLIKSPKGHYYLAGNLNQKFIKEP